MRELRCVTSHKLCFARGVAAAKLERAQRERETLQKTHRREQAIYKCPDCGWWHLTSKMELTPDLIAAACDPAGYCVE